MYCMAGKKNYPTGLLSLRAFNTQWKIQLSTRKWNVSLEYHTSVSIFSFLMNSLRARKFESPVGYSVEFSNFQPFHWNSHERERETLFFLLSYPIYHGLKLSFFFLTFARSYKVEEKKDPPGEGRGSRKEFSSTKKNGVKCSELQHSFPQAKHHNLCLLWKPDKKGLSSTSMTTFLVGKKNAN